METEPSSDCKDGKSLFGVNGGSSPWDTGNTCGTNKALFPPCHKHTPETKSSWPSLLFGMPHLPCCTTLCVQAGHWGIPRALHQPSHFPHHTHRMGSRSQFPSLKSTLLHAKFMQGYKVLGSFWNTQGICFPQRFPKTLYSKASPRWERTQRFCQQKAPLLRALLRLGRGCHLCPCSLCLFLTLFD